MMSFGGNVGGIAHRVMVMRGCCGEEGSGEAESCDCGCGEHGFARRYKTKAERVEGLKAYLKELETEAEAVREAIADLA